MERLPKLFLSIVVLCLISSCQTKREKAEDTYRRAIHYPQGSMMSINGIKRAAEIDPTFEQAVYELSVAYLKRGLPHKWKPQYNKAVDLYPELRVPRRGYLYLWFYRDYKKAIEDFNASDSLTPDFIDNPQGHSVDFWRGIAYLGLNDYKNCIRYFDKHIKKETEESGEDWVEHEAFLYRGIAYYESGNSEKALENFNSLLKYNPQFADAKYYKAKILLQQGNTEEAKTLINEAIDDFYAGFYNKRPYVEALRQLYIDDYETLRDAI